MKWIKMDQNIILMWLKKNVVTRNIRFQFLNITYSYGLQDKENKDDKTSI